MFVTMIVCSLSTALSRFPRCCGLCRAGGCTSPGYQVFWRCSCKIIIIIFSLFSDWSNSMSRLNPRNCWHLLSYAIKNQLRHPKPPTIFCLPYAGIKAPISNRTIPCMEATYAIKNQRGASKVPP